MAVTVDSPIIWLTPVTPLGVPVTVDGYNWRRKVRVTLLSGRGRGHTYYALPHTLLHHEGTPALNAALGALKFLPSAGHYTDPGAPQLANPTPRKDAPARAPAPATTRAGDPLDGDPLDGVLL